MIVNDPDRSQARRTERDARIGSTGNLPFSDTHLEPTGSHSPSLWQISPRKV